MRPELQNVVHEQHVAVLNIHLDVSQDLHLARGPSALAVTRQRDEIDLGLQAHPVQRPNQVGRKHEAALQNGNDQKPLELLLGNLCCERVDPRRDLFGREDDFDLAVFFVIRAHPMSPG